MDELRAILDASMMIAGITFAIVSIIVMIACVAAIVITLLGKRQ